MIDDDDWVDLEWSDLEPLAYDDCHRYDVLPAGQGKRPLAWIAPHSSASVRYAKRQKNRAERRRARLDPEAPPGYGRYRGWDW